MELVGFEPTSKQRNHTLSTRLFQPSFSCHSKTWTTNYALILLFSLPQWGLRKLFPIVLHRWFLRFGKTSSERCLVALPCNAIKPVTYCTSVRQRERNCFRQLNFRSLCLRSKPTRLRVLTYHLICCQIQSTPVRCTVAWAGSVKPEENSEACILQALPPPFQAGSRCKYISFRRKKASLLYIFCHHQAVFARFNVSFSHWKPAKTHANNAGTTNSYYFFHQEA